MSGMMERIFLVVMVLLWVLVIAKIGLEHAGQRYVVLARQAVVHGDSVQLETANVSSGALFVWYAKALLGQESNPPGTFVFLVTSQDGENARVVVSGGSVVETKTLSAAEAQQILEDIRQRNDWPIIVPVLSR